MWTMAILAVVAFLALRVARGIFRWFVRLVLLLVALPIALGAMAWWQAHAFTTEVMDHVHVGMTYDQARKAVQALEAAEEHHVLLVPKDLASAQAWTLVRPIAFFRARVNVTFQHGKVTSLEPGFGFD